MFKMRMKKSLLCWKIPEIKSMHHEMCIGIPEFFRENVLWRSLLGACAVGNFRGKHVQNADEKESFVLEHPRNKRMRHEMCSGVPEFFRENVLWRSLLAPVSLDTHASVHASVGHPFVQFAHSSNSSIDLSIGRSRRARGVTAAFQIT